MRLSDINVEHGPPAQAYFNGSMAIDRSYEAALEDKPSGWATVMSEAFPKLMSLQVTGGSTSTIDAFEKCDWPVPPRAKRFFRRRQSG